MTVLVNKQEDPKLRGGLSYTKIFSRDGIDGHGAAEQALALEPDRPEFRSGLCAHLLLLELKLDQFLLQII